MCYEDFVRRITKMMKLFIKENIKNNKRMSVRDSRGQILYIIEGRWGRKKDKMSIYRTDGTHLMSMVQVKMSPIPVFELIENNEKAGTMRKHPGLFGIRDSYFTLHPHKWIITGDFEDLYFTTHKENELIMECEKDLKSGLTIYEVMIKYEEDAPLSALITTLFDHYSRKRGDEKETDNIFSDNYELGFFNPFSLSTSKPNHYPPKQSTKPR